MQRREFLVQAGAVAAWTALLSGPVSAKEKKKKVLYFTHSVGFEHSPVHRKGDELGFSEKLLVEWGKDAGFDVDCTKDGTVFDKDLGKYDVFAFYTCGDLTQPDKFYDPPCPPMTLEGKKRLLDAIAGGKGFVAFHSASDSFHSHGSKIDPYIAMLGGEFVTHQSQQPATVRVASPHFPGVEPMGKASRFTEEWYALKNFAPDMHVILVQETKGMHDACYQRPPFPQTWARMHHKGRVFFTSFGHREDIWTNPKVKSLILGGFAWALCNKDADVTPNLKEAAPHADQLPK